EADVGAVLAPRGDAGADHDALDHVALLHVAAGQRLLDAGSNDIAQVRDAALAAAEHLNAHHLFGPGVVGHIEGGIHVDHDCLGSFSVSARPTALPCPVNRGRTPTEN